MRFKKWKKKYQISTFKTPLAGFLQRGEGAGEDPEGGDDPLPGGQAHSAQGIQQQKYLIIFQGYILFKISWFGVETDIGNGHWGKKYKKK